MTANVDEALFRNYKFYDPRVRVLTTVCGQNGHIVLMYIMFKICLCLPTQNRTDFMTSYSRQRFKVA